MAENAREAAVGKYSPEWILPQFRDLLIR